MPPKKDAFADLFQSANSNKKSMAELGNQNLSNNSSTSNVNGSKPWDEFDIFSSKSSVNSSASVNDPFAIFDNGSTSTTNTNLLSTNANSQINTNARNTNLSGQKSQPQGSHTPQTFQPKPQSQSNGLSLLDDEFTDAFVEEPPKPEPESEPQTTFNDRFEESTGHNTKAERQEVDERDNLVAQLLDIGFPVDVANNAIDSVGMDLQACVNFIMSGGSLKPSSSGSRSRTRSPKDDFGSKINDLSSDFFSKASIFLNKSKDTVIKNFEQFQQAQGKRPSSSMPAWMQNQAEYKSKASERRANGEKYEDYGSDEDNIDQESIREFMEQQRQKDKARNKARMDHLRSAAKEKITGDRGASSARERSPAKQTPPPRPSSENPQATQSSRSANSSSNNSISSGRGTPKPAVAAPKQTVKESNLLDIGTSRSERFKAQGADDVAYVSSRRRRANPNPVSRKTTREPLDQFMQSDYDIGKEKATKSFSNGDYDDAFINYEKCLNALPPTHELRVIINSNLAITLIKLGNYKKAREHCDQGLALIGPEEVNDTDYLVNDKPIKFWYTKLLSRKAEALEMTEAFPESLECYMELVTKLGVNDKKVMDAKRRVNNIVNPPPKPKPQPKPQKPVAVSKPSNNSNTKRIQEHNKKQEDKENLKFKYQEQVQAKVFAWSNGKEDNLRTLLMSLPDILPASLRFPFLTTKKITINDLMLPKKVKNNYMKVISAIHPDKLASLNLDVEHEMLCQSVFIMLNKSWDLFKEQNGLN